MEKVYDPKHTMTYGYYVCKLCKSNFYGGGPAIHNEGCPDWKTGSYEHCEYHYGPNERKPRP